MSGIKEFAVWADAQKRNGNFSEQEIIATNRFIATCMSQYLSGGDIKERIEIRFYLPPRPFQGKANAATDLINVFVKYLIRFDDFELPKEFESEDYLDELMKSLNPTASNPVNVDNMHFDIF